VAIFIFLFSLVFQQNQKIALFFAITAAIFAGGSGAVIIGGLYWKRGTTAAAWSAMIVGAVISVGGVLVKQISIDWLSDSSSISQLKLILLFVRDINGQEYYGIGMALSTLTYIIISLFGSKESFNMDKLLNRGDFAIEGEKTIVNENKQVGWKIFLMGNEFTRSDKFIYILNYVWTGVWTLVFIIGTTYNISNDVSNQTWMLYWKYYIYVHVLMSLITMVWFSIGGFKDLKIMMKRLRNDVRDHGDDGWVSQEKTTNKEEI
jgi:SSS family solute:Na+ symporter